MAGWRVLTRGVLGLVLPVCLVCCTVVGREPADEAASADELVPREPAEPAPGVKADKVPRVVHQLPAIPGGGHFVGNRAPLLPSRALKLPIGCIEPRGWLREQLRREASGMVGHLAEISPWLRFDQSAWASPTGEGVWEWEELPYWLKGFGDLGYVLADDKLMAEARRWIEPVLASGQEDGYFGPRRNKTRQQDQPDLWPHMVMLNVLQSYYEYSGDPRVIGLLTGYFRWQLKIPEQDFLVGYWPKMRAGDNLESVYWLYNRTGDKWLLELAHKIHRHAADWTTGMPDWHNVNIAQGFREPAVYFMQTQNEKHLSATLRNYDTVMRLYGQFPGGGFAGDEVCRPDHGDPRQAIETCAIVEFMHSFEMLTKMTGRTIWADRCEELAFNTFPVATTPDFRGLHYLTAPNMAQLDRHNKQPSFFNANTMLSYSPTAVYRCCQHNVSHGWPYFAEELWLATTDGGLCASLYVPSQVTAKVGAKAAEVAIEQATEYPFDDTIQLTVSTDEPVAFPLYLRVPGWCEQPRIWVNDAERAVPSVSGGYVVLERTWESGDTVRLQLSRKLEVKTWKANHDGVSVHYGPLAFSLEIKERWEPYGGSAEWPELEVFPESPWNYGLVLDEEQPSDSFEIVKSNEPLADYPFTPTAAPLHLMAKGRRIREWTLDQLDVVSPLQQSPTYSEAPVESIRLIPLGCARLRIGVFPVASSESSANRWVVEERFSASHCNPGDTVCAVADGVLPANSADVSLPRLTFWDHKGSAEWVERSFGETRQVSGCRVYWFDDSTSGGGCATPQSWEVLYQVGDQWLTVAGASGYETAVDRLNRVQFEPVETTALRLKIQLQPEWSGGVLEWEVRRNDE